MAISWDEAKRAMVREIVTVYPEVGYDAYARLFDERGLGAMPPEAARRVLRDVGLGTRELRLAYATEGHKAARSAQRPDLDAFISDKKEGRVNWRDLNATFRALQEQSAESSWAQDEARLGYPEATKPIVVVGMCDAHWGSFGTDYDLLERFIDFILAHPEMRLGLLGDFEQMAIKLRGVLEVMDNIVGPRIQHGYTESVMNEIEPQVLWSTWDNHSVTREEDASGDSAYARIMSRRVTYFNHIGHADVVVGKEIYRFAVSHVFRGRSRDNPVLSQMKYIRYEAQDREIAMAGDSHVPGFMQYWEGGRLRTVTNGGTFQTNSGYAKRYFSLNTLPAFPMVELFPDRHAVVPYFSLDHYCAAKGYAIPFS